MDTVLRERFEAKYIPVTESGCWIWEGATGGGDLRGRMKLPGTRRNEYAHRISWMLHRGPIPDDKAVLHRCDVGLCVNPYHLFLGTQIENIADRQRKGRSRGRCSR